METLYFEYRKKAIARFAGKFLKQKFNLPSEAVSVLMDNYTVLIRVDRFLSKAEQKMGTSKQDTDLIRQIYSEIFDKMKGPFINYINKITGQKVISSQVEINFETKILLLVFILS